MNHLSTFCETNEKLEEERHKYAVKHGFVHTVPRLFKKCIVVRWKLKSLRNKFSHQTFSQKKFDEYLRFCSTLVESYDLCKEDLLLDNHLRLFKVGIYAFNCHNSCYNYPIWVISNEKKEVQDYVLKHMPQWAKFVRKD